MNIELELTTFCPFRCAHCYIDKLALKDKVSVFSDEKFCKEFIIEISKFKIEKFILTGGEPTLFKNFDIVVTEINKKGIPIKIFTNGVYGKKFWANKNYANSISSAQVTMYGFSDETYANFTGASNGFIKAKEFIEEGIERGKDITIQLPNLSVLKSDIENLEYWAQKIGITIDLFRVTVPIGSYNPINHTDLGDLLINNIEIQQKTFKKPMICGAGSKIIRISSSGHMKGCHLQKNGIKIINSKNIAEYVQHIGQYASYLQSENTNFCSA